MKTLKENLLADMETSIKTADDIIKKIDIELSNLNDVFKDSSNFAHRRNFRPGSNFYVYRASFDTPHLLKCIGRKSDVVKLSVRTSRQYDEWDYKLCVETEGERSSYSSNDWVFINSSTDVSKDNFEELLEQLVDIVTKSIDSFNKFLSFMSKNDGNTFVDVELIELLK